MKNINVLSLLLLLASAQIHCDANAELSLVYSGLSAEAFQRQIASDNDDAGALKLLETMDECISFDIDNKKAVAAANGILFKTPLDQVKIDADIKSLQSRIDTLDHNISEFKKGGIMPGERARVDKRRAERRDKKQAVLAQEQARKESQGAMDSAQKALASLQDSLANNELLFEQALESYILSFGQCFVKSGSIVISSKYDQSMPITAKEYNQLIAVLNKAYNTFGAAAAINLDLDNNNVANAQQVANYVKQVPLASAQSWAMFGAKAALGIGAAILATAVVTAAVAVGSNVYQGKNWNDTDDAMAAYNSGMAQGSQAYENAMNSDAAKSMSQAYDNLANSSAAQSIAGLWNNASSSAKNAWDSAANSSAVQSIESWFGVMKPQQQQQAVDIASNAMDSDDALVIAAAAQQLSDAVSNGASDEEIAHYADLFDSMEESLGDGNLSANLSDEDHAALLPYAAIIMAAPTVISPLGIGALGLQAGLATYQTLAPTIGANLAAKASGAAAARAVGAGRAGAVSSANMAGSVQQSLAAGQASLQNAGAAISAEAAAALAAAKAQMEAIKQAALGVQQKYAAGQAANAAAGKTALDAARINKGYEAGIAGQQYSLSNAYASKVAAEKAAQTAAQAGYNPQIIAAQNAASTAGSYSAAALPGLAAVDAINAYNNASPYDSSNADESMNASDADYDFFN